MGPIGRGHRSNNNGAQLAALTVFFELQSVVFRCGGAYYVIPQLRADLLVCLRAVLWQYHVELTVFQLDERFASGFTPWELPPKLQRNRHKINQCSADAALLFELALLLELPEKLRKFPDYVTQCSSRTVIVLDVDVVR